MAITLDGTTGITTPAETITTNLTFTGTGNRITGDFSNATAANQVSFQTSTVNGSTIILAIPNGTSAVSAFRATGNSDPNNASYTDMFVGFASTQSIIRAGQVGTGTYLPLTFYTGGSERARIDTSGNVGIGTASPNALLHVSNSVAKIRIGETASSAYLDISRDGATGYSIYNAAQADPYRGHVWQLGATEAMRINSSGNVGIGTSSPLGKLKVTAGDVAPAASGNMNTGVIYEVASSSRAINFGVNNTAGYSWINAAFSNNSGVPDNLVLMTGATERMRIDSSGYVGIGTSSPASRLSSNVSGAGSVTALNLTNDNNGFAVGTGSAINFGVASGSTVGAFGKLEVLNQTATVGSNSYMAFSTRGADVLAERMRIDSSGNVGIGATTLLNPGTPDAKTLTVSATKYPQIFSIVTTAAANNTTYRTIARDTGVYQIQLINDVGTSEQTAYEISRSANSVSYQRWFGGTTEAMRIDSSGNLLVGTTSLFSGAGGRQSILWTPSAEQGIVLKAANTTFNGSPILFRNDADGTSGFISQTQTTVSYITSSDYRLKENILEMTGALDKVTQLKPVTYTWKETGYSGQGFIAHELQAIVPDCVVGDKDAVNEDGSIKPQGIDTSFLVATLTAAIQEQQALIIQLQADVAALKALSA